MSASTRSFFFRAGHHRHAWWFALPIHPVHAWGRANGLMLGQVAVGQKSNEITAVPALLELLDLKGVVVSMDAMHGQKDTAKAVRGC